MDDYAQKHLTRHLYSAGPGMHPKLFDLVTDHKWYLSQRIFDPSRSNYISDLDLGVLAALEGGDCLPEIFPMLILRGTMNTLLDNLPVSLINVLANFGQQKQVQQYTELMPDTSARCESLCLLAVSQYKHGDIQDAHNSLVEAYSLVMDDAENLNNTQTWALIASTASSVQMEELCERTVKMIQDHLRDKNWETVELLHRLHLFERPEYLLAVAKEGLLNERENDEFAWESQFFGYEEKEIAALPIALRVSSESGDESVMDEVIREIKKNIDSMSELGRDSAIALAESSRFVRALDIIDFWEENRRNTSDMRSAVSRIAGQQGEVEVIKTVINTTPIPESDGDYIDISERLNGMAEGALFGSANRVFGLHIEQLGVFWVGMESLSQKHPEKAKQLWEFYQQDKSRIGSWIAEKIASPVLPEPDSTDHDANVKGSRRSSRQPSTLLKYLNLSAKLADRFSDDDYDELVIAKAFLGGYEHAMADLDRIDRFTDREGTILDVAKIAFERGDLDEAVDIIVKGDDPAKAEELIDMVCNTLLNLSPEQAQPHLEKLLAYVDVLPEEESLGHTELIYALMFAYASRYSTAESLNFMQELGVKPELLDLLLFSEIVAKHNDLGQAGNILKKAEGFIAAHRYEEIKVMDVVKSKDPAVLFLEHPIGVLTTISKMWSDKAWQVVDQEVAQKWTELAYRAFHLAKKCVSDLPRMPRNARSSAWLPIASTARNLIDEKTLLEIWKKIERHGNIKAEYDPIVVEIAVGLTLSGEYMRFRDKYFPVVLMLIRNRVLKAQALVEMWQAVSTLSPKKKLFGGYGQGDLDFAEQSLLDQAREMLKQDVQQKRGFSLLSTRGRMIRLGIAEGGTISPLRSPTPLTGYSLNVQHPLSEALNKIIRVFVGQGWYSEACDIVLTLTPESERAVVYAETIKMLREAGQTNIADEFLGRIPETGEPTRKRGRSLIAPIQLKGQVLEALAQNEGGEDTEPSWSEFRDEIIKQKTFSRDEIVDGIGELAPSLAANFDQAEFKSMVLKILFTDSFWFPENIGPSSA